MEPTSQFNLINGTFSAAEALHLLMGFYNEKILFHNRQLLALKLKNAGNTHAVEAKISELQKTRDEVFALLNSAKTTNVNYKIKGVVEITPFIL